MNTTASPPAATAPMGWFASAESWLDQRGKGAWIAAMVLGFIFFWPVGLALLFYMIWSNRMSRSFFCARNSHASPRRSRMTSSGNTAFDSYRDETLKRLEDEQVAFQTFLQRLRDARDKTEFDQFMDERARDLRDDARGVSNDEPDARPV